MKYWLLAWGWLLIGCGDGRLEVDEAWVGAVPPVAKTAAAYLIIDNGTDRPQRLERVESPVAGRVELHRMRLQDELMTMERVQDLQIAPGQRLALAPGGTHIMLMQLARGPQAGEAVELTLHFADHAPIKVMATVARHADMGH